MNLTRNFSLKIKIMALSFVLLCACGAGVWNWGAQASAITNSDHHYSVEASAVANTISEQASPTVQPGGAPSIAGMLNPDGTVKPGIQGSFDTKGFKMETTAAGAPRFVPATACCGWDTQFGLTNGTNGQVRAFAMIGNDVYVGGTFTVAGGVALNNIARYNTVTNTWSALGTGGGNGVNGTVSAMAVMGSDLYVGGSFGTANVGGVTVPTIFVAKFDTLTGAWSMLGGGPGSTGVNSSVNALAVIGNDLYVGGFFTSLVVNNMLGATVNRVAKFNTTTSTWSALGTGGGNGVSGSVFALATIGSNLFVAGSFATANVGGVTVTVNNIAKLDTTTGTWSAMGSGGGSGVSGNVNALAVIGSDLYVGGNVFTANVGGVTVSTNFIAKFNTGTSAWSAIGSGGGNGVTGTISALATDGSNLYVGGFFTSANSGGPLVTVNRVAKFDPTGSTWSALGSGGGAGVNGSTVSALLVSGGKLYVGGSFSEANFGGAAVKANNLAMFDTGSSAWSGFGVVSGNGVNGAVNALAAIGSDLYVGGFFTAAGGVTANNIARFNTVTNTWSALGSGGGNGVSGNVLALAVIGSDLYVGGSFFQANVGGPVINVGFVAKFDTMTNTWSALGSGGGDGTNSTVSALTTIGGNLYVGGFFTMVNIGAPITANRVAKFDTVGGTWSALGSGGGNGVSSGVNALAAIGSDLYVGGFFATANVGGSTVSVNNIAKFDTGASSWSALGSGGGNGVNSTVRALAAIGSDLYVGGFFNTANVGGTTVAVNSVAKFTPGTGGWSALGSGGGNGVSGSVYALSTIGANLYVGGNFATGNVGGAPVAVNNVAMFDTGTGAWSALADSGGGNGVNGLVSALKAIGSNIFVGGGFGVAGDNKISSNIGRYCPNTLPSITPVAVNRTEGAGSSNSQIATVSDAEDAENTLSVTVNGGASATVNGVTVSNITVDAMGVVKADVVAACGASNASFTLRVTDCGGLFAEATLNVTVTAETVKPVIICPSDIGVGTIGNSAAVTYAAPSVSDNCSGVGAPVCSPPSGSVFPLGVTTVTCSVTDARKNSNSCSFKVMVNNVSASFSDPLDCTGPGNVVTGTIKITNSGNVAANAVADTTLPGGLLALPGTCAANIGSCSVINASQISYAGAIPAGQTVTITYQAQIGDQVTTGTKLCAMTEVSFNGGPKASVSPCVTVTCPALGPGQIPNAQSPVSDQRAGSVLIYNLYTSSASSPNAQNTRISLTNIHGALGARVHLFFVDGSNCSVADSYVCLTANQTTSFLAADLDPGTTGYIVAVAVDDKGCPVNFNYLIGDEYVKLESGHAANLGAEAFTAIAGGLPRCDDNSTQAELKFDGVSYSHAPRVLALSNIASRVDGNDTLLVLNRIGGNLATGAATLTDVFGIFYDDSENGVSFTFNPRTCQFRSSITSSFPRITPRFESFVPSGRSGWLKLYSTSDQAILGAAINFNGNAGSSSGAFNQGHNLHKLTLTTGAVYTIPIFPPSC